MNYRDIPDPPIEPPEDYYITADCGHEVYEGESAYEWCGKLLCSYCFKDAVNELEADELASIVGSDVTAVTKSGRCE